MRNFTDPNVITTLVVGAIQLLLLLMPTARQLGSPTKATSPAAEPAADSLKEQIKKHFSVRKEQNMRYSTIEETPRNRPIGVTIIALLLGIQAIFGICIGVVTMIGGLGSTLSFLGIIATVLGLIELFFAWGLWTLRRWAFWATVIIELLSLVNSALSLFQPRANVGVIIGYMILPIVILLYFLVDSNVRAAFRT